MLIIFNLQLTRLELFCSSTDESVNNLKLSPNEYLKVLAPPMKDEEYMSRNNSNHTTSLAYIRTLPLLDQIRILMKDGTFFAFFVIEYS